MPTSDGIDGITVDEGNALTSDADNVMFALKALPLTVRLVGTAPTSLAVYDGLLDALAQLGTVGSVSVYDVKNPESLVRSLVFDGIDVDDGSALTSEADSVMFADRAFPLTVLDVGTAPTSLAV